MQQVSCEIKIKTNYYIYYYLFKQSRLLPCCFNAKIYIFFLFCPFGTIFLLPIRVNPISENIKHLSWMFLSVEIFQRGFPAHNDFCSSAQSWDINFSFWLLDCEASFKGRFKLREHMRSHTQEKLVACPTCGGMFANNTKFFDHIRRQTSIEGERACVSGGIHAAAVIPGNL